jgi:hypothetical protein
MVILGHIIQIRREKIFLAPLWVSTGLKVKNIDMTRPVPKEWSQKFFLGRFEFYDPKLPKDDVFEGYICLDLIKYYTLTSQSSTDPGSDRKKNSSAGTNSTLYT